jgi:hypothetical protein
MTAATATCHFAAVLAADAAGYSHRAQSWSVGRMSALHLCKATPIDRDGKLIDLGVLS